MATIDWIAKNPKTNIKNQSNQVSMLEPEFNEFMRLLIHSEGDYNRKLEFLLHTKGFFSGEQAAHIVSIFARPKDKIKSIMILEPKLISMTCQQARNILACVTIHEDRLEALQYVKRALNDANTQEGLDNILSCFTFEDHKFAAMKILHTVVAKHGIKLAAGGHSGYAPLGGLYTNAPPNNTHFYGPAIQQVLHMPNHSLRHQKPDPANSIPTFNVSSTLYKTNNPNYHFKNSSNYETRNDYLNPSKI